MERDSIFTCFLKMIIKYNKKNVRDGLKKKNFSSNLVKIFMDVVTSRCAL